MEALRVLVGSLGCTRRVVCVKMCPTGNFCSIYTVQTLTMEFSARVLLVSALKSRIILTCTGCSMCAMVVTRSVVIMSVITIGGYSSPMVSEMNV